MAHRRLNAIWANYSISPDPSSGAPSLYDTSLALTRHSLQPHDIIQSGGGYALHHDLAQIVLDVCASMDQLLRGASKHHGRGTYSIGSTLPQVLTGTTGLDLQTPQTQIISQWILLLNILSDAMRELKDLCIGDPFSRSHLEEASRYPRIIASLSPILLGRLRRCDFELFGVPVPSVLRTPTGGPSTESSMTNSRTRLDVAEIGVKRKLWQAAEMVCTAGQHQERLRTASITAFVDIITNSRGTETVHAPIMRRLATTSASRPIKPVAVPTQDGFSPPARSTSTATARAPATTSSATGALESDPDSTSLKVDKGPLERPAARIPVKDSIIKQGISVVSRHAPAAALLAAVKDPPCIPVTSISADTDMGTNSVAAALPSTSGASCAIDTAPQKRCMREAGGQSVDTTVGLWRTEKKSVVQREKRASDCLCVTTSLATVENLPCIVESGGLQEDLSTSAQSISASERFMTLTSRIYELDPVEHNHTRGPRPPDAHLDTLADRVLEGTQAVARTEPASHETPAPARNTNGKTAHLLQASSCAVSTALANAPSRMYLSAPQRCMRTRGATAITPTTPVDLEVRFPAPGLVVDGAAVELGGLEEVARRSLPSTGSDARRGSGKAAPLADEAQLPELPDTDTAEHVNDASIGLSSDDKSVILRDTRTSIRIPECPPLRLSKVAQSVAPPLTSELVDEHGPPDAVADGMGAKPDNGSGDAHIVSIHAHVDPASSSSAVVFADIQAAKAFALVSAIVRTKSDSGKGSAPHPGSANLQARARENAADSRESAFSISVEFLRHTSNFPPGSAWHGTSTSQTPRLGVVSRPIYQVTDFLLSFIPPFLPNFSDGVLVSLIHPAYLHHADGNTAQRSPPSGRMPQSQPLRLRLVATCCLKFCLGHFDAGTRVRRGYGNPTGSGSNGENCDGFALRQDVPDSAGRKPSPNFKTSLMELQRNLKEIEHSWKADVLGWWGAKISLPAKLKSLTCRVSFRAALLRTPRFQIKWGCQSFRYECTMHCVRTSIAPFRLLTSGIRVEVGRRKSQETRGPGSGPRYYRAPSGMDTLLQARSLYGGLIGVGYGMAPGERSDPSADWLWSGMGEGSAATTRRSGFGEGTERRRRGLGEGMETAQRGLAGPASSWAAEGSESRWNGLTDGLGIGTEVTRRRNAVRKIFLCLFVSLLPPAIPSLRASSFLAAQEWGALYSLATNQIAVGRSFHDSRYPRPFSTLHGYPVESELGYTGAEHISLLSEILKRLDRAKQGLHHIIRLIARQGKRTTITLL
ncbi:hypothetical protein C8R47DRAFT_1071716 [Mycena vitilis]|nr:hypothetical protein C8R47DRAFT_1071716 [Mycena vitilis]